MGGVVFSKMDGITRFANVIRSVWHGEGETRDGVKHMQ